MITYVREIRQGSWQTLLEEDFVSFSGFFKMFSNAQFRCIVVNSDSYSNENDQKKRSFAQLSLERNISNGGCVR